MYDSNEKIGPHLPTLSYLEVGLLDIVLVVFLLVVLALCLSLGHLPPCIWRVCNLRYTHATYCCCTTTRCCCIIYGKRHQSPQAPGGFWVLVLGLFLLFWCLFVKRYLSVLVRFCYVYSAEKGLCARAAGILHRSPRVHSRSSLSKGVQRDLNHRCLACRIGNFCITPTGTWGTPSSKKKMKI